MKAEMIAAQCEFCMKKGHLRVSREGLVTLLPGEMPLEIKEEKTFFRIERRSFNSATR